MVISTLAVLIIFNLGAKKKSLIPDKNSIVGRTQLFLCIEND